MTTRGSSAKNRPTRSMLAASSRKSISRRTTLENSLTTSENDIHAEGHRSSAFLANDTQNVQVDFNRILNARPPHFDDDVRARRQGRSVHLADGRRT